MKNLLKTKYAMYLIFFVLFVTVCQSCIVYNPYYMVRKYNSYDTLSVNADDIVRMSKDGVSSKDIIKDIRKSHTVYLLDADQLAKLKEEGVQDSVINFMEETRVDASRQNLQSGDLYYWHPLANGYLFGSPVFGWPYGYWLWNWAPAIIFRSFDWFSHGYHGGGYHGGGSHGGGVIHSPSRRG